MKDKFIKFNIWWGNRTVLHILTAFTILTIIIGFVKFLHLFQDRIPEVNLIGAIIISIIFGFGKEFADLKWGSGKFEKFKAVLTTLGGIVAYVVSMV